MDNLKKLSSSVGSSVNRAVQMTEEKVGHTEKTEYDHQFVDLIEKAEQTKKLTEKLVKCVVAMLQPNPATRVEQSFMAKMDTNIERIAVHKELGMTMVDAGNELGANRTYGKSLIKTGQTQVKVGLAEEALMVSSGKGFIMPLRKFLNEDMKTIDQMLKNLQKKRLDLDAAKSKVKRSSTTPAKHTAAEADEAAAQVSYDKLMETTRPLLEKVEPSHAHHLQCLNQLIGNQKKYYGQCHQLMQELKRQLKSS